MILHNKELTKKILDDSPISPVKGEVIEEGSIMTDAIAFFPKLVTPADSAEARKEYDDAEEIDVHFTKDISGYVNKLYIQKRPSQFTSKVSENYMINVNPRTGEGQIHTISEDDVKRELSECESFTMLCPSGFEVRTNPTLITEAINTNSVVTKDWFVGGHADEINIMRTFNSVLEVNEIKVFADDMSKYLPTMNWFKNSPFVKEFTPTTVSIKLNESDLLSTPYKLRLIHEVESFIDDINDFYSEETLDTDSLLTFINHISTEITTGVGRETNDEQSKTSTMMNSLYRGMKLDNPTSSRLSELYHMITLYIYLRYIHEGASTVRLTYMFPFSEGQDVSEFPKYGTLLIVFMLEGRQHMCHIGEEDGERFVIIDSSDTDILANQMSHKGIKTISLSSIDETIADNLLHTKFSSVADVISSMFFNIDIDVDNFVMGSPFSLTEDVLLEASSTSSNLSNKRNKIMTLIRKAYKHVDLDGSNLAQLEAAYGKMTDEQFMREMKLFVKDDERNFHLEVIPNKNEPLMKDIRDSLKAIGVPENEYIYMRHFKGTENDPVRTRHENTVGYLHIKRLQQMLSKKNSYSLDIKARNVKTMQVTAADKVARISDLESSALMVIGAEKTLKEFMSSRADDMGSKNQLYSDINTFGYAKLEDMPDDLDDKVTLNTINNYLTAAGIASDLTVDDRLIKEINSI